MLNRTDSLRTIVAGKVVHLPTEWTDADELRCTLPVGEVVVVPPARAGQQAELFSMLEDRGLEVFGCFNCRFYTQRGTDHEAPTSGYCLHGREGRHVNEGDRTAVIQSCDAYQPGTGDVRNEVYQRWAASLPRKGNP